LVLITSLAIALCLPTTVITSRNFVKNFAVFFNVNVSDLARKSDTLILNIFDSHKLSTLLCGTCLKSLTFWGRN